jgi:hypothetical protein
MVDIVAATGTTVTVPDDAINIVSGPYPSDSGTKSYIRGNFGPGALESNEDASHLVGRLQVTLAMLTRPNEAPVWVKTGAITILRYPLDTEIQSPPNLVRSVVVVGGFLQALREDIAAVRQIISNSAPGLLATSSALTRGRRELTSEFFAKAARAAKKGSRKVTKRAPRRGQKA